MSEFIIHSELPKRCIPDKELRASSLFQMASKKFESALTGLAKISELYTELQRNGANSDKHWSEVRIKLSNYPKQAKENVDIIRCHQRTLIYFERSIVHNSLTRGWLLKK
ncbi:hypothetical protein HI914_07078 [Erysiphe necator]|nr:hypothetical protein HI914_07078 [Erysiphe necator]